MIYRYSMFSIHWSLKREIRINTASIKMNVKLPCRQAIKQCFDLCQNFEFSMASIVYKLAHAHLKWFNPKWNQTIKNETKRGTEALILPKLQKLTKFQTRFLKFQTLPSVILDGSQENFLCREKFFIYMQEMSSMKSYRTGPEWPDVTKQMRKKWGSSVPNSSDACNRISRTQVSHTYRKRKYETAN